MNLILDTLRSWSEQGWLRRLDSATADFLNDHDPGAEPAALVAAAMLAHMEGRGHVCLSLAHLVQAPQRLLAWPEKAQASLQALWAGLPALTSGWVAALAGSAAVREVASGAADTGQPFVLGGTPEVPLLYLRRYWVYEQQVAQAVASRAAMHHTVDPVATRAWLDRLFPPQQEALEQQRRERGEVHWQKVACALALRSGLTVITGGPGTGKTYTAARLLALLLVTSPDPTQLRVGLAAPTGKAAARLRQSIDQSLSSLQAGLGAAVDLQTLTERMGKASTVHSLLGVHMGSRQFKHNARNPLDLDVLIVDETSMIHLEMMAALLQAMPARGRLILLGDKDQLASVEAGSVLGDLCTHAHDPRYSLETGAYVRETAGETLPGSVIQGSPLNQQTVMLRQSHRFGSAIGALALAVNAGLAHDEPIDTTEGPRPGAYRLLEQGTREALATQEPGAPEGTGTPTASRCGEVYLATAPVSPTVLTELALRGRPWARSCYADYIREIHAGPVAGATPHDPDEAANAHAQWVRRVLQAFDRFRILCAVHDGDWGDRAINEQVQRALAAQGLLQPQGEWYLGRPIMVTRNDKALGVFNGDVGVVLPPAGGGGGLRAFFLDGEQLRSVSVSRLADVETAFAMTIHKSQGSEFAHTVVVLPASASDLLTRELVYTGITRARESLSLIEPITGLLGVAIGQQVQRASGLSFPA
ncbi:MAG: AAA family ATPase [Hydrogenophaga sp.]|uniref:AAA family ATPase n=1 Tax=Hydrogenophaga sp. TaxID=1904254 RepID=UPI0026105F44|nr:AAA family ATPase [Hydrogenophaga sp.]MDM7943563.1 AAA family ATPase [Hydrogenophaga sp.]